MATWSSTVSKQPRVLCVDDDPSILSLTRMVLEYEGYNVLTASSGRAALEQFSSAPLDAVVLDYEMPGMNGGEVACEMKKLNPRVPKLLFTSCHTVPTQAVEAIEGFCPKMDGMSALLSSLHTLLEAPEDGRPN